ncbi:MAG TPA: DUF2511 domain-containing protein [Acidimicrobiales bacterium]|nr:DUF2511 domain-containing protein [Acidimicrobiales bacterium]
MGPVIAVEPAARRARRDWGEVGKLPVVFVALLGCFAAVLAVVLLLVSTGNMSADSGAPVSRAELGEEWPVTVPSGILRCERGSEITFQADGTTYTLNRPSAHGAYRDVGPILVDAGNGTKKDPRPLLERGLRLCD